MQAKLPAARRSHPALCTKLVGEVPGEKLNPCISLQVGPWTGFGRDSALCHTMGGACQSTRLGGFRDGLGTGGSHPSKGVLGICLCPMEDHVLVEIRL